MNLLVLSYIRKQRRLEKIQRAIQERHRQFFFDMEPTQAFVPSKQSSNRPRNLVSIGITGGGYDNKAVEGVTFS